MNVFLQDAGDKYHIIHKQYINPRGARKQVEQGNDQGRIWKLDFPKSVFDIMLVCQITTTFKVNVPKKLEDKKQDECVDECPFAGLTFVVTGELKAFPQRNADGFPDRTELKKYIERRGGKLASSVSAKTSYLITNTPNSGTRKNRDAQALGVKIITEEEFFALEK